jgi:hypothetical protein
MDSRSAGKSDVDNSGDRESPSPHPQPSTRLSKEPSELEEVMSNIITELIEGSMVERINIIKE